MADTVQSVKLSQTDRSSLSTASHQVSGSQRVKGGRKPQRQRRCYRPWRVPDGVFEAFELHFHETPLHLFESYFAESQQNHCTFASRNNPGIILPESAETSEADSSDDDSNDKTVDGAGATAGAKGKKRVTFGKIDQCGPHTPNTKLTFPNDRACGSFPVDSVGSTRRDDADAEHHAGTQRRDNVEDSANEVTNPNKPPYMPDDELFKERWADPWDRPPGQMWTKKIQNQHNLRKAIKEAGFTGARLTWLFDNLVDRKRYRFPYMEKYSVKRSHLNQAQYMHALKQRRKEELAYANQVKEYDEESAFEECKWALELYDKVYGPDWPENTATQTPDTSTNTAHQDDNDSQYEEDDLSPKRQKTCQHTPPPEPFEEGGIPAFGPDNSDPACGQRASVWEMEKSNETFRAHKAEMMEAARKKREEADAKEFMQVAIQRPFSNGYAQPW